MNNKPLSRIPRSDLENLMATLEVSFVRLSECIVGPGWRLALNGVDAPGIHYNLEGSGRVIFEKHPPIELYPHTLFIGPRNTPFVLEGFRSEGESDEWKTLQSAVKPADTTTVRKHVAGEGKPQLTLICGYFHALYGASVDLFGSLNAPIVEQFSADDLIDLKLKTALAELVAQDVGIGVMTAALLKLVLVPLLRRSFISHDVWAERFSALGDPQIARAFAAMATQPSAEHSIHTLSHSVGVSRSAFMARFTAAFGQPPIAILRQLRMSHAAALLESNTLTIDQIAHAVGYENRSSFTRAFRKIHERDPSDFRNTAQTKKPV